MTRQLTGTIISNKMINTAVVRVDRLKKHPKYKKYYRVSKKFKVHDENGEFKTGDVVIIEETRPMSKDKRWQVAKLIKRPQSQEETSEG